MSEDTFSEVFNQDVAEYAEDFEGILDIDSERHAKRSIDKLDSLYEEYERKGDKKGLEHSLLVAEVARNRARIKGLPNVESMFEDWIQNKKE